MTQLQMPALDATQFEANGVVYTLDENMTISRYRMFERFRIEVGFGVSMTDMIAGIRKTLELLERGFQGELVIGQIMTLNQNLLKGVANSDEKYPFAVWMNTLFFNAPGEDKRVFDQQTMTEKIKNWEEAGIAANFFIYKACSMIADFNKIYEETTRQFSSPELTANQEEQSLAPAPQELTS